jgi:hypothetical protein
MKQVCQINIFATWFYDFTTNAAILFFTTGSKLKQRLALSLPQMRTMKINEYDEMKVVSINFVHTDESPISYTISYD